MHAKPDGAFGRAAAVVLPLVLLLPPVAAASEPLPRPEERIADAILAAWQGPDLASVVADLDAVQAGAAIRKNPGAPYVEAAREGIGPGFSKEPNSVSYLRYGAFFNGPGQSSRGKKLKAAALEYAGAGGDAAALEVADLAAGAWLDLAAEIDRLDVRRRQLQRVEGALRIQRKRLELGEISGSEVVQLELERTRLVTVVADLQRGVAERTVRLHQYTGPDVPLPVEGDLPVLLANREPLDWDGARLEAWVESSPALLQAGFDAERIRQEGDLAQATARGRPAAEVSWEHIHSYAGADGFDTAAVRLIVPLPVGKLGKLERAQAEARNRGAEADRERVRRELTTLARSAAETASAAAEAVRAIEPIEGDLGDIEFSLSEQFRLGVSSYLVYIDGVSRLDDVRVQAIDARHAELRARLALAAITGDPTLFPLPGLPEEDSP
jgi:outer membrane protein TolC